MVYHLLYEGETNLNMYLHISVVHFVQETTSVFFTVT